MSNPARGTKGQTATKSRRRYQAPSAGRGQLSWTEIGGSNIVEALNAVCEKGGALRFGYSSDGGAWALGVYGDGPTPYTLFSPDPDTMREHLANLTELFSE